MHATIPPQAAAPCGTVSAPPSKSMAHRALLCAALASGESRVRGIAPSEDMRATMRAMRSLGAHIDYDESAHCAVVRGAGARHAVQSTATLPCAVLAPHAANDGATAAPLFPAVTQPIDCGESGSTLRFVIPLFSLTNAPVTLTGHGRLPSRPQGVYADLFAARGLHFAQDANGITLCGALTAGAYTLDGSVSSQFISGLLFALPLLLGDSVLHITQPFESRSYVALTLQVLADFGVRVDWLDENTLCIYGNQKYIACDYIVEGDCSQAAFFAVLAACCAEALPHANRHTRGVTLTNLRLDTRQGDHVIFEILHRCGAHLVQDAHGSVTVHPSRAHLHGIEIDLADCPDLGPILMVLGLFCAGETVLRNAGRLRVKESDRIAAMEEEIRKLGGSIHSEGDTVFVRSAQPTDSCNTTAHLCLHPSTQLQGHGDHRIVMSMVVAVVAARLSRACEMDGAQAIHKSYPAFFVDLAALGVQVETA